MKVTPDTKYQANKEYYKQKAKEWKAANKEKNILSKKKTRLKAEYGLSWDAYELMYKTQNGTCRICTKPIDFMGSRERKNDAACVDHCHITGRVRGLLCLTCNSGLGQFQDNILFLESAIRYLKEPV